MSNRYLEKIAAIQEYKTNSGKPITDKTLAAGNTVGRYASKLLPGGLGYALRAGSHAVTGRSLEGAAREEVRGKITGMGKSVGYGLSGAAAAGAIGAGVGVAVGNRRMARFGANAIGKGVEFVGKHIHRAGVKMPFPTGKQFLDSTAGKNPEMVRKILSDKHLGAKVGAGAGAIGGLLVGGVAGDAKGQYDGRLASIRNQIREGNLKNVTLTESKKK